MHYFLLDANALVAYYTTDEDENLRKRVASLFAARAAGRVFLYVPNFCIAETLRAFAKKCFQQRIYDPADFDKFRKALLEDVVGSKVLYSFELSRRHILMTDRIYETAAKLSFRKGSTPSAMDVLIIAMGCDLQAIHGAENVHIVTADGPLHDVCEQEDELPATLNLNNREIPKQLL